MDDCYPSDSMIVIPISPVQDFGFGFDLDPFSSQQTTTTNSLELSDPNCLEEEEEEEMSYSNEIMVLHNNDNGSDECEDFKKLLFQYNNICPEFEEKKEVALQAAFTNELIKNDKNDEAKLQQLFICERQLLDYDECMKRKYELLNKVAQEYCSILDKRHNFENPTANKIKIEIDKLGNPHAKLGNRISTILQNNTTTTNELSTDGNCEKCGSRKKDIRISNLGHNHSLLSVCPCTKNPYRYCSNCLFEMIVDGLEVNFEKQLHRQEEEEFSTNFEISCIIPCGGRDEHYGCHGALCPYEIFRNIEIPQQEIIIIQDTVNASMQQELIMQNTANANANANTMLVQNAYQTQLISDFLNQSWLILKKFQDRLNLEDSTDLDTSKKRKSNFSEQTPPDFSQQTTPDFLQQTPPDFLQQTPPDSSQQIISDSPERQIKRKPKCGYCHKTAEELGDKKGHYEKTCKLKIQDELQKQRVQQQQQVQQQEVQQQEVQQQQVQQQDQQVQIPLEQIQQIQRYNQQFEEEEEEEQQTSEQLQIFKPFYLNNK